MIACSALCCCLRLKFSSPPFLLSMPKSTHCAFYCYIHTHRRPMLEVVLYTTYAQCQPSPSLLLHSLYSQMPSAAAADKIFMPFRNCDLGESRFLATAKGLKQEKYIKRECIHSVMETARETRIQIFNLGEQSDSVGKRLLKPHHGMKKMCMH